MVVGSLDGNTEAYYLHQNTPETVALAVPFYVYDDRETFSGHFFLSFLSISFFLFFRSHHHHHRHFKSR
jgi:hypothetical protein